jgi:hypothetical protein
VVFVELILIIGPGSGLYGKKKQCQGYQSNKKFHNINYP